MDKRGPKVGDAASLWNFTPSPGWTKEESLTLKLCLMKFGIGQWIQIQATGLLPGKLIQQLNGATQRLLGQQSLAAFSGLRLDIDRIRADNEAKTEARRKNGLVIWDGPNPTKEMRLQWQQEAKERYELTAEQLKEAEAAYEQIAAAAQVSCPTAAAAAPDALPPDLNILDCDVDKLVTTQKQLLLCALHQRLLRLVSKAVQQQPGLASRITYHHQQEQQQQQQSWIALGIPTAGSVGVTTAAAASGSGTAAAAAAGGFDSDATGNNRENHQPHTANLRVRQAGTAAARKSKLSKGSTAGAPSKAAGSSKQAGRLQSNSKKRSRSKAAAAADDADDEDAYLQRQQQRRGSGRRDSSRGGSSAGGGGDSMLADMMKIALEAGVNQLVDMGYSRTKALDALKECNCDVDMAVEYLTTHCC